MAQLLPSEERLECHVCDMPETRTTLYRCLNCTGKKANRVYCYKCGKNVHTNMDHRFAPKKTTYLTTPNQHETNQLVKYVNDGKSALIKAVGAYITDGTMEKFQYASETVKGVAVGALQGKAGSVSVANATIDAARDIFTKTAANQANAVASASNASKALIATGSVLKSTAIVSAGIFACEMIYLGIQYGRGQISWNELGRRVVKSAAVNTGSLIGNVGGFVGGAMIGSCVGPVGTVIGGIIGAIIGALAGGVGTAAVFEKLWPAETQNQREKMIAAAMKEFGIRKQDLNDKNKFNKRSITKKYHQFARMFHPDRIDGNEEKFREIGIYYGILLNLFETMNGNNNISKENAVKMILAIEFPGMCQ